MKKGWFASARGSAILATLTKGTGKLSGPRWYPKIEEATLIKRVGASFCSPHLSPERVATKEDHKYEEGKVREKRSKNSSFVFGERPVLVDGPDERPRQLPRVSSCDNRRELTVCGLLLGSMGLAGKAASIVSDWPLDSTHIVHEHALEWHCLQEIDVAVRKGYGLISLYLPAPCCHWRESRRTRLGRGRRCNCEAHWLAPAP